VVSMGGIVSGRSVPVGGFDLDAAIQDHVRRTYGVAIGDRAAEQVKVAVGTAFPSQHGSAAVVRGRDLGTGDTVEVTVFEDEVRQAMAEPVGRIVEGTRRCLAEAPPELTHDILETGVFLTGGGSLLRGLDVLVAQECEVPVHLAERPLDTVVVGAGRMLERLAEYRSSFQLVRGPAGGGR
ncbi:MAG TPA: rod shape-determining protein, partial [Actinomycetota bacterium]|nr:rod shape-determining protein [Actinomycetota bacterium]